MENLNSKKIEKTSEKPLVGKYQIIDLSIEVYNENNPDMEFDFTELIDELADGTHHLSIEYDGSDWIVDGECIGSDSELENHLYLDVELRATRIYPDSKKMYIYINEMDYNLIHIDTETVYELKK